MFFSISDSDGYFFLLENPDELPNWANPITTIHRVFIKKNNLFEYYGLCKFKGEYKKFLYFIPLVIIVTRNFWCGATLHDGVLVSVLGILSMLFVGFLEAFYLMQCARTI